MSMVERAKEAAKKLFEAERERDTAHARYKELCELVNRLEEEFSAVMETREISSTSTSVVIAKGTVKPAEPESSLNLYPQMGHFNPDTVSSRIIKIIASEKRSWPLPEIIDKLPSVPKTTVRSIVNRLSKKGYTGVVAEGHGLYRYSRG
jgi:hypothetical protein